jgi:hypothetical protein
MKCCASIICTLHIYLKCACLLFSEHKMHLLPLQQFLCGSFFYLDILIIVLYLIGNVMKMPSTFGLSLGEADQTLSDIISSLLSSLMVSSNIKSTKMWI